MHDFRLSFLLTTLGVTSALAAASCAEMQCPTGEVLIMGDLCVPESGVPPSPAVQGERSSGHTDPAWLWELVAITDSYDVRCRRCGAEIWTPIDETQWRASDLAEGDYVFEVRACNAAGCSTEAQVATTVEFIRPYPDYSGYWNGVGKSLARSPTGHVTALVAHNAYVDDRASTAANLHATIEKIDRALADGADVIELDIKELEGEILVDHDDTDIASRARLTDVLDMSLTTHPYKPQTLFCTSSSKSNASSRTWPTESFRFSTIVAIRMHTTAAP